MVKQHILWFVAMSFFVSCIQVQTKDRPILSEGSSPAQSSAPMASSSEDVQLKLLENQLHGRHEIEQYSKALPYFLGSQERIEFLSLEGFKARQQWLMNKNFWTRIAQKEQQFAGTIKAQDIAIGMTEDLVKRSWGQPLEVFVSGQPAFRNARWVYQKQVSTNDGYRKQKRTVYIEAGQVRGWDVE